MYAMDQKSNLCFFFNSMFEDENHLNLDWCGGWKRWLVDELKKKRTLSKSIYVEYLLGKFYFLSLH